MTRHTVPTVNWATALARILKTADKRDTVVVHSDDMKTLAMRAMCRMRPDLILDFVVEEPVIPFSDGIGEYGRGA